MPQLSVNYVKLIWRTMKAHGLLALARLSGSPPIIHRISHASQAIYSPDYAYYTSFKVCHIPLAIHGPDFSVLNVDEVFSSTSAFVRTIGTRNTIVEL